MASVDELDVEERGPFERERHHIRRQFGANLGAIREARGLTQEELAGNAKLHRTEIGYLEQGRREPRLQTLLILADTLGMTIDQLVAGVAVPRERKPATHSKQKPASEPPSS